MDPKVKKFLRNRPFAHRALNIADEVDRRPMTSGQAQVSATAMIAYAILEHADAVRELTAALERRDGDA